MDASNQIVRLKTRDVYHHDPTYVLLDLYGKDLSDSSVRRDAFIEVEVEGMAELMIVPVERIHSIP